MSLLDAKFPADPDWPESIANPRDNPEKCGLEILGELEYSSGCYEFDTRVFWRQLESGRIFTAKDSGCSCPDPFEDFKSLADMEEVTTLNFEQWARQVGSEVLDEYSAADVADARQLMRKVKQALKDRPVNSAEAANAIERMVRDRLDDVDWTALRSTGTLELEIRLPLKEFACA